MCWTCTYIYVCECVFYLFLLNCERRHNWYDKLMNLNEHNFHECYSLLFFSIIFVYNSPKYDFVYKYSIENWSKVQRHIFWWGEIQFGGWDEVGYFSVFFFLMLIAYFSMNFRIFSSSKIQVLMKNLKVLLFQFWQYIQWHFRGNF